MKRTAPHEAGRAPRRDRRGVGLSREKRSGSSEGPTYKFIYAGLVDEDGNGDAEYGEQAEIPGRKPESPLDHLAREGVGLDERVRVDVSGVARASHCVDVEERKKSAMGQVRSVRVRGGTTTRRGMGGGG